MPEKYQPTPEEMKIVDDYMAEGSEMAEQSAEREKEQREFESRTRVGFDKFKSFVEEVHGDPAKKRQLNNLLAQSLYLYFGWYDNDTPCEINEVILLMSGLFDQVKEMDELADKRRKFENGVEDAHLLKDLKLTTLEVAGRHGGAVGMGSGYNEWPLQNVWYQLGVKDFYMSDVDVEENIHRHDDDEEGYPFDKHIINLDALNPGNALEGKQFDFMYSAGFFGHPTAEIAKDRKETQEEIEQSVVKKLEVSIRPGGYFVAGARELYDIKPEWLESQGFDVLTCELFNNYIVARKKGIFESGENE